MNSTASVPKVVDGVRCKSNRRIALVLPDFLPVGGVERIQLALADDQLARGNAVDLILMTEPEDISAVAPEGLEVTYLKKSRLIDAAPALVSHFRSTRPDIVLASMWPITVMSIIANLFAGCPARVIVSDHNPLTIQYARWGLVHRLILKASIWLTYRFASERVAVSNGVASDIADLSGMPLDRITTIYNPIKFSTPTAADLERAERYWSIRGGKRVLAVGRLKEQKNFGLLIESFVKVTREADAQLVILGTGPLEDELQQMIEKTGMRGHISLAGHVSDPTAWYATAGLFVLSSDYEGFGNVIVEALAAGLPVVSTDCPSGPAEILQFGEYGTLVPVGDREALSAAIIGALSREVSSEFQKKRAYEISGKNSLAQYDAMFRGQAKVSAEGGYG